MNDVRKKKLKLFFWNLSEQYTLLKASLNTHS